MNKRLISLMAAALALLSAVGQVTFTNVDENHPVIEISLSNNHTSLNKIYVVYDIDGVGMTFNSPTGEQPQWESYDYSSGHLHTEELPSRWNGITSTLNQPLRNTGYIITVGTDPFHCWVVNYADYQMELNGISFNDETSCRLLSFDIDGYADAIHYYDIDGNRKVLDREIKLKYKTLVWDKDELSWGNPVEVVDTFPALDQSVEIETPLCNTDFLLTGDRFLEKWKETKSVNGEYLNTRAVGCVTTAYFLDEDGNYLLDDKGNPMKLEGELSDGSAPVRILFTGYPTPTAVYRKWEMATDPDFENVILQYNQDEVDYTFYDAGTYYIRYMVANDIGSCEYYGDSYTINVSESQLGSGPRGDLPNAFSPDGDGINDVWKVSYKSLVEFHCWIYNRWGNLVYEYTDPDGGWNGTYRGKLVDTGVYYYVVTALGSDGKKYRKRGDISILRYKKGAGGTNNTNMGDGY